MKLSKRTWILAACCAVFTLFIFSNSMKNGTESMATSNAVLEFLAPVLNFLEKLFGPADWVFIIRKGAHLTEFGILGVLLHCMVRCIRRDAGKSLYGFGLFYALATGVTDEFIQSFSDRTSSVSDVLIDFTGGLVGFGIVALVAHLHRRKSL